ncbi:MAG: pyrroline-5-carboxylate reductase [Lachnospiraceae bacterium]|jgi:pyrroline-5-carboxylate reductase|nr:pyrroline-5-carboxylate reductase [Lachnospiraceae bacterium]
MKTGVIGCGNMATAIIGGLIAGGFAAREDITASDRSDEQRRKLAAKFGVTTKADNKKCVENAEIVLFAVKPNVFPVIAEELREAVKGKLIISIMAGRSIADLEAGLGEDQKIVRAMPNTPALVGAGITGWCANKNVTEAEKKNAGAFIAAFSEAVEIPESLMPVVTSVSGSSPAFVYMFIEALADGAVAEGMPRDKAYRFAAKTVLGSAKMVLDTGKHPGELKDMVTSPGGTTIEGVAVLEQMGFRAAAIEAVRAAAVKAREM